MAEAPALKVLIIHEDKEARRTFREALEAGGCAVAEAARGDIGVELAKRFVPAVILLDLAGAAGMGGDAVLRALKLEILTTDIPVVLVSSLEAQQAGTHAPAVAARLVKPVEASRLLATVRQVAASRIRTH